MCTRIINDVLFFRVYRSVLFRTACWQVASLYLLKAFVTVNARQAQGMLEPQLLVPRLALRTSSRSGQISCYTDMCSYIILMPIFHFLFLLCICICLLAYLLPEQLKSLDTMALYKSDYYYYYYYLMPQGVKNQRAKTSKIKEAENGCWSGVLSGKESRKSTELKR